MKTQKIEAIKRHLDFAINAYFEGRDIIPIFTVAGAAHNIAHDLVQRKNPKNTWADMASEANEMSLNGVLSLLREKPNWLKHAKRDPDSVIEISHEEIEHLLFHATLDLGELLGRKECHSVEGSVYQLWYIAKYNNLFQASVYDHIKEKAEESFPKLDKMAIGSQLGQGLYILNEAKADV